MEHPARSRETVSGALWLSGLALGAALVWAESFLYSHQTLAQLGWSAEKRSVWGIQYSPDDSRELVSGFQLNLGAAQGHQDVYSDTRGIPARVEFDFSIADGSYLDFTYGRTAAGFHGVRLSGGGPYPSIAFESDSGGRFVSVRPLDARSATPGWHAARIAADGDDLALTVDGAPPVRFPGRFGAGAVGFRAGLAGATVRDLRVGFSDGSQLREGFRYERRAVRVAIAAVILIAALLAASAVAARVVHASAFSWSRWVAWRLLAFGVFYLALDIVFLSPIPEGLGPHLLPPPGYEGSSGLWVANGIRLRIWMEIDRLVGWSPGPPARAMRDEFLHPTKDYCPGSGHGCRRAGFRALLEIGNQTKRGYRLALFGGSEAFGSGARASNETYFEKMNELLAKDPSLEPGVESFNLAAPGERAGDYRVYPKFVDDVVPDVVVIQIGDRPDYWGDLPALFELNRKRGIRTIAVSGPGDPEEQPFKRPFPAGFEGLIWGSWSDWVRSVDLRDAFEAPGAVEGGVTNWDSHHLTSYGQELVARWLAPRVAEALKERPPLPQHPAVCASRAAEPSPGQAH